MDSSSSNGGDSRLQPRRGHFIIRANKTSANDETRSGRVVGASASTVVGTSAVAGSPDLNKNSDNYKVAAQDKSPQPLGEVTGNTSSHRHRLSQIKFGSFEEEERAAQAIKERDKRNAELMASFAAKAREAEYQAEAAQRVRSRVLETSGPSSFRPISLGAFTKTTAASRNKGNKGWKPLTLEDIEEHPSEDKPDGEQRQSTTGPGAPVVPPDAEGKGKENETVEYDFSDDERLTHIHLPRIYTNLSPSANRPHFVGHLTPDAARGNLTLPSQAHLPGVGWRDQGGEPLFPWSDWSVDYPNGFHGSHFRIPRYSPHQAPSFQPLQSELDLDNDPFFFPHPLFEDHEWLRIQEVHRQEDREGPYPTQFHEDPFMATPPQRPGRYGSNTNEYHTSQPSTDTYSYGQQHQNPLAVMSQPTYAYHVQPNLSYGQTAGTGQAPRQTYEQNQLPRPQLSTVSSVEDPKMYNRRQSYEEFLKQAYERAVNDTVSRTVLRDPFASSGSRSREANQESRLGFTQVAATTELSGGPLASLVSGSDIDASATFTSLVAVPLFGPAAPSFVPGSSYHRGAIMRPPGLENVQVGVRRVLPNNLVQPEVPQNPRQSFDRLTQNGVLLSPAPRGGPSRSRLPAAQVDARDIETFTMAEWEAHRAPAASEVAAETWFRADGRGEMELRNHVERLVREGAERRRRDRAAAREGMPATLADLVADSEEDRLADASTLLLGNAAATLVGYVAGDRRNQPFAPFGAPPEWAVSDAVGANLSFFEEDWGSPPPRVGRDRRFRPFEGDQGPADEPAARGRRQ